MKARMLLVTIAALGAAAVPAQAAKIEMDGSTMVVAGEGTEDNTFFVWSDGPTELDISDSAGSISSFPASCEATGYGGVSCDVPAAIRLDLGAGSDRVDLGGFGEWPSIPLAINGGSGNDELRSYDPASGDPVGSTRTLDGGEGDDVLKGSSGDDTLRGGPGNDGITGYTGDDVIEGGDGDDALSGDKTTGSFPAASSFGADHVDGGPGIDRFDDYSQGSATVDVTVDGAANDGRPGEGDNLIAIEVFDAWAPGSYTLTEGPDRIFVDTEGDTTVIGLGGDDDLEGAAGREVIDGGAGDDVIEGGYNDDVLTGGPGRDRIVADEGDSTCGGYGQGCYTPFGNDRIEARDGEADSIDCGEGTDVAIVDALDTVAENCETVDRQRGGDGGGGDGGGGTSPSGNSCAKTPKVKGLKLKKARRRVKTAGCTVKVRRVRSAKVRKGRVVRAKRKGTRVTLHVSKGR